MFIEGHAPQADHPRKARVAFDLRGVPYLPSDRYLAISQIIEFYNKMPEDSESGVVGWGRLRLLDFVAEQDDRVARRCAVLAQTSSIILVLILLSVKLGSLPVRPAWLFYAAAFTWSLATLRVWLSLRHDMAEPWEYGGSEHFALCAATFVHRVVEYNIALRISLIAAVVAFGLLLWPS